MKIILFVVFSLNIILASDTVVIENLEWQDNSDVSKLKMKWKDAVVYCSRLELNNHSDWRLPTIKELQSIVDIYRHKPAIKKEFHNVSYYGSYFTSSFYLDKDYNIGDIWTVGFSFGETSSGYKEFDNYVRCVRDKQ